MLHSDALQSASLGLPGNGFRQDGPESINFEAILHFLRKRRRLWLSWVLGGLLLGILYATFSPPSYTATAAVLLQDPTPRAARETQVVQSDTAHSSYIETQLQIFTSDEVIGRVVDTLNLIDDEEFGRSAGGLRSWLAGQLRSLLRSSQAPDAHLRYESIVRFRRALAVRRVGTSDVLEIQFTSGNRQRAADFADAVIHGYVESRIAEQESEAAVNAGYIRQLLIQIRDKAFPAAPAADAAGSTAAAGPEMRARFMEEQQSIEAYRSLYGRLLQQAIGDPNSGFRSGGLQIITPPAPPLLPGSRLMVVIAFSGIAGVLGFGHALLCEATDDTLRTRSDLSSRSDLGRLTVVPLMPAERSRKASREHIQPHQMDQCLPVYELMGKLAVSLVEGNNRSTRRLIAITSPTPGAGTSTIAGHLAQVFAATDRRTCLVNANWRQRPTEPGIREASVDGKLVRLTRRCRAGDVELDVVTIRSMEPVPDLVASRFVVSVLEEAASLYDFIIVDLHSPACTMDLEATISLIDHVIVVVEARRSTKSELRQILDIIPCFKRAAVVLNKVTAPVSRRSRQCYARPNHSGRDT